MDVKAAREAVSRHRFALFLSIAAAVLCFYHYLGFDPKNLMLMSLSVPLWIAPMLTPIHSINLYAAYLLTIGSWALIGYFIDRFAYQRSVSKPY